MKKSAKLLSLVLCGIFILSPAWGCRSSGAGKPAGKKAQSSTAPVTITFGTHYVAGLDPNYVDPVTKKPVMSQSDITAAKKALAEVKKQLNVNLKFVQYSGDVRTSLLQSVMAGSPVCDVALMWGGSQSTILSQNVLQPIDDYADVFKGDGAWMLMGKFFGHHYFIDDEIHTMPSWPLVYNITYLEKVDALKRNGKTQFPADLFKEGKWTWNVFEDYLSKIGAFYANSKSPDNPDKAIQAYETDYRFAARSAGFSAGRGAYDEQGLGVNSPEFEQGVGYIAGLFNKKLLTAVTYENSTPQWTQNGTDFGNGETVFTDIPGWLLNGASSSCAKRGESVGIVPWPRPDALSFDSSKYRQISSLGNTLGVLKGVGAKKARLALETMKLYWNVFYDRTGLTQEQFADKQKSGLTARAAKDGIDVFNKTAGPGINYSIDYLAKQMAKVNDFAPVMSIEDNETCAWDLVLRDALYGKGGISSYNVGIESKMNVFDNRLKQMENILKSDKLRDNIAPSAEVKKVLAFAKGTEPSGIKWSDYVSVTDNVDKKLDKVKFDGSAAKFNKTGTYDKGLHVTAEDKSGNKMESDFSVMVYDPSNKTAPTVKLNKKLPEVTLNQDASTISWKDFIESAKDKDGLDVTSSIKADISKLDTSTAGKYDVMLTVTDFAGNQANVKFQVIVSVPSD